MVRAIRDLKDRILEQFSLGQHMKIGPFKSRPGYISFGQIDQWYEELAFPFTVEGLTEN